MTHRERTGGAIAVPRAKGSHLWSSTGRPVFPPPETAAGWTTDGGREGKKVGVVTGWMLLRTPHPRRRYLILHHARQDALGAPRVGLHNGSVTRAAEGQQRTSTRFYLT